MLNKLILLGLLVLPIFNLESSDSLDSKEMQCEAYFIEENDINVELYKVENTRLMYFNMVEALAIRIDLLLVDASIAIGAGDESTANNLKAAIDQNLNDVMGLQTKYEELNTVQKSLVESQKNLLAKKTELLCEPTPPDLTKIGESCKIYPERLNDTIICKSYYYIKEEEKMNGSKTRLNLFNL